VRAGNWLSHLEFEVSMGIWAHIVESLSEGHRLVRYDPRGNGLSDHDVADLSFERWVSDLETVVEAAGLTRFVLTGFSQGAAVATAFAARHPDKVSALLLVGGLARGWRLWGGAKVMRHFDALLTLTETGWGQDNPAFRQVFSRLFFPNASAEVVENFNRYQRGAATPANAVRILSGIGDIDIRDQLDKVSAPTLVLHARGDRIIPFRYGQELAQGIRDSTFVAIESDGHVPRPEEPLWTRMEFEIQSFLAAHS